jgi:subtilase family serine protease
MGKQAIVTFPDGSKKTVPLDAKHTTTILNLPRGTYTVRITAGSGIVAATQFVLSKDKIVDVPVISILDMAILAAIAILVAMALVLIGRRRWRNPLIRKLRRPLRGEPLLAEQREEVLT